MDVLWRLVSERDILISGLRSVEWNRQGNLGVYIPYGGGGGGGKGGMLVNK